MKDSDVQFHGAEFETSIDCTKCKNYYVGRIPADNEADAARRSIEEAREAGWTDGPLCPECSKEEDDDEDEE